jgi:uncharacterized protein (TIGR02145 family)
MRNKLTKIVLAAALVLALALTFSCSSDNGNELGGWVDGSSSSVATNSGNGSSSSATSGGSSSSVTGSVGSSSSVGVGGGSYTEKGNNIASYRTKQIVGQVWMAENLNYAVEGSRCYGEGGLVYNAETGALDITLSNSEIQANCNKYGRLYNWATAMALPSKCNSVLSTSDAECAIATPNHRGICPSGWHIPSDADWNVLMKVANPSCSDNTACAGAGKKLKAISGWNDYNGDSGNGTDDFGFAALPGGFCGSFGFFLNAGYIGYWWSASEYNAYYAYYRIMGYPTGVYRDFSYKGYLFSIRCLQD